MEKDDKGSTLIRIGVSGESSFWYRPTRVVPDQRPLNGRCCTLFQFCSCICPRKECLGDVTQIVFFVGQMLPSLHFKSTEGNTEPNPNQWPGFAISLSTGLLTEGSLLFYVNSLSPVPWTLYVISCLNVCYVKGPSHIGNSILAREGMLDMIIAMADSGSAIHVVSTGVLMCCIQSCIIVFVILLCMIWAATVVIQWLK